jgi:hypothetical protein
VAAKAASYAALIRESLGVPVAMEHGRMGQFEVQVDGRIVVSRKGGLIAKLTGKPWPAEDDVLDAVRAALGQG